MPLTSSDMADLQKLTHRSEGRMKFQQIAQELQQYEVLPKVLTKDKVQFLTGRGIQRNVMVRLANSAQHAGLLDEETPNIVDLMEQISVDWVLCRNNYGWLETEMAENSGREMILNVVVPRRKGMMIDIAQEMEEQFWATPNASNSLNPFGALYYIVKNSSAGFNGGAPSGFTYVAGLNPTTYPKYKNYTGTYGTFSKRGSTGLVRVLRKMYRYIKFVSPVSIPDYRNGKGDRYRFYTTEQGTDEWMMMAESQNDNLGIDLQPYDDEQLIFKKHPIVHAWQLDSDTAHPFYAIDWSVFHTCVLKGFYFREMRPIQIPLQPLAWYVPTYLRYNWIVVDRRRLGVVYQA